MAYTKGDSPMRRRGGRRRRKVCAFCTEADAVIAVSYTHLTLPTILRV